MDDDIGDDRNVASKSVFTGVDVKKPSTIAIDGTAASGKSTVGSLLAEHLGYVFFDTGIMYRAVTWAALEQGVAINDEEGLARLAEETFIDVELPSVEDGRRYTVRVNGRDVTWDIRKPEVDAAVSPVSAYPGVREALTAQQRRIGNRGHIVMVGRDIGTVVLPEAGLKVFLDATPHERARRRYLEMTSRGANVPFEDVLEAVLWRDEYDSGRAIAPLSQADDAVYIDTTHLTVAEVLSKILSILEESGDC